ncbi:sulfotransferase family protein [Roseofilum capinflatum]|uniref:Sulfotransferase n=1 Tax=Roseofilum capinflatum BLCC-M114 TaxID=3022440 RepID=A0ABT7B122_9CYAN|nr:sulfotransferase [Roseofilum capinflatum]MDJ1172839.1 sulfotransferase [Roseofilum capinflatum BLCC-M114]
MIKKIDRRNKVVFVISMGRSGSTLVELMIGSHPDAFSLGEISKLPQMVQKGRDFWYPEDSTFWLDNFTKAELKQFAAGMSNHRLHRYIPLKLERLVREWLGNDEILNPYTILFSKTKQSILTDSSKEVSWISNKLKAREFRQNKIDAYLLYNVRDGRAVINSYLRFKKDSIENLSHQWVNLFKEQSEFYNNFSEDRKLAIRYEEMATNPHKVLQQICHWLDIEFVPDMIEYWKHDHHHVVGSRGANALIAKYKGKKQKNLESHGQYYQDPEFKIKLDMRWKQELSPENLQVFNQIAGELNKPYEWNLDI